jgi:type VI secretion system protein ImpL
MLRTFLRIFFSLWTLRALLLLGLLAVIWLIGPLVQIGNWRPLDTSGSRWVLSGLLLFVALMGVVWRLVQAKRRNRMVVDQLVQTPDAAADSASWWPCASALPRHCSRFATRALPGPPSPMHPRACGRA